MSTNVANSLPPFSQKTLTNITWGAGGTVLTITDANLHPNSQIEIWVTGSTPQAGNWSFTYTQGQVVITSSASESSSLPLSYYIN